MRRKEYYPKRALKRMLMAGVAGALGLGLLAVVNNQPQELNNPADEIPAVETNNPTLSVSQEAVDLDKGVLPVKWSGPIHPFGAAFTTEYSNLEITVEAPISENVDEDNILHAVFPVTITNVSDQEINREKNTKPGLEDFEIQDIYSRWYTDSAGDAEVIRPFDDTLRLLPGESVQTEIECTVDLRDKDPYKHAPFLITGTTLQRQSWLYQPFAEKSQFAWSKPGTAYQAGDVSIMLNHFGYSTDKKTGDFTGDYLFDFTVENNSDESVVASHLIDGFIFGQGGDSKISMTDPNEDSTHTTIYPGERANVTLTIDTSSEKLREPVLIQITYPDETTQLYGFGGQNMQPYHKR